MPKKPVIAIVDDDTSVREGTMDLVKAMGFIAEAFSCAEEFLKSKRLHSTSCLIADVRMPGVLLDRGRADAWNDRTRAPQSFGSVG